MPEKENAELKRVITYFQLRHGFLNAFSVRTFTGFNTFKVDPNATTEQHAGDEHGSETHIKQEHQASALTKGKGTSNGKGKKQNRQAQLQAQLQRTPSPDAAQQQPGAGEDEDGYVSSASDVLPPSLMANYDESTGLLMGKPRTKVMYLLMKAKHRYATEQHDILSGQLRNARAQLEHEKFEKESALNEVLYRMLGCAIISLLALLTIC